MGDCSTFEQDCPEGAKCSPWANDGGSAWNAAKCVPISPDPDATGEPCTVEGNGVTGIDSCDGASMCFKTDVRTGVGVCYAFCTGGFEDPGCPADSHCLITAKGVLNICIPTCDPVGQNDCADDEVCVATSGSFSCVQHLGEEAVGYLEPCGFLNACDHGLFCANAAVNAGCEGAAGCCIPFCDLDEPTCLEGTSCLTFYEDEAPEGLEHVGYCGT